LIIGITERNKIVCASGVVDDGISGESGHTSGCIADNVADETILTFFAGSRSIDTILGIAFISGACATRPSACIVFICGETFAVDAHFVVVASDGGCFATGADEFFVWRTACFGERGFIAGIVNALGILAA
jgi:hypothetical protein